ncbi:hypothetical protein TIFTF001_048965 [Ficus carica]|uniref:Uncharacterized protein n=1 Tax=Ficus carica TaxID=3494 RepID=A0AA88CMG3_FICCA|nr:hypothetical protein TIFTF001_048965 [Ficus carica]
MWDGHCHNF